jgi:hypothetical protein
MKQKKMREEKKKKWKEAHKTHHRLIVKISAFSEVGTRTLMGSSKRQEHNSFSVLLISFYNNDDDDDVFLQ